MQPMYAYIHHIVHDIFDTVDQLVQKQNQQICSKDVQHIDEQLFVSQQVNGFLDR